MYGVCECVWYTTSTVSHADEVECGFAFVRAGDCGVPCGGMLGDCSDTCGGMLLADRDGQLAVIKCFGFIVCVFTVSVLVNVIVEDNNEGLLECTRVYGNLSRHTRVRAVLARNKGESLSVSLPLSLFLSFSVATQYV